MSSLPSVRSNNSIRAVFSFLINRLPFKPHTEPLLQNGILAWQRQHEGVAQMLLSLGVPIFTLVLLALIFGLVSALY